MFKVINSFPISHIFTDLKIQILYGTKLLAQIFAAPVFRSLTLHAGTRKKGLFFFFSLDICIGMSSRIIATVSGIQLGH